MASSAAGNLVPAGLRDTYTAADQAQVFEFLDKGLLSTQDAAGLIQQLKGIDPKHVNKIYHSLTVPSTSEAAGREAGDLQPIAEICRLQQATAEEKLSWQRAGLAAIALGKVAAVVLSGGQGTRLNFDAPKGMYDIGLPSHKSLFQLQAERITRVRQLAAADHNGSAETARLPWYIMTSPLNNAVTRDFFERHNFFGLPREDVFFLEQGTLPCLSNEGKILMESGGRVAEAPDGNGGIYPSLARTGALADMIKKGVEYLHVFAIDNALVKVADPLFIGYCIQQNADCGNKSVWKASADEKVGVVVLRGGKPCVVEYSEMAQEQCQRVDQNGRLVFGAGNICNHFFTLAFLRDMVLPNMTDMYHMARKKIPYADAQGKTVKPDANNGVKLESFIFDVFSLSSNLVVFEVERDEEFAPVKNAEGFGVDSPDTARAMIAQLTHRWAAAAGARLGGADDKAISEISPLVSYAGEGLQSLLTGKVLQLPFTLEWVEGKALLANQVVGYPTDSASCPFRG